MGFWQKFWNVDEQRVNGVGRHWIIEKKPAKLNLFIYFKDVLILKWNSENVLHWAKRLYLFFQRKKIVINSFILMKIIFDHGRSENLGYKHGRRNEVKLQYKLCVSCSHNVGTTLIQNEAWWISLSSWLIITC